SIGIMALLIYTMLDMQALRERRDHSYVFSLVALFLLFFLPKLVMVIFHGFDDLLHAGRWLYARSLPGTTETEGVLINRVNFLSQLGLIVAAVPFTGVLYGVTKGRHNFNVARVAIRSTRLPKAFDGLRIVQISDMHLGSYGNDTAIVRQGIDLINAEKPDMILFTGDLVNDYADETKPFTEVLKGLKAPLGKYSILGNHDYSDYPKWESAQAKAENLVQLKQMQAEMGFKLLLDEHDVIEIDGEKIGLLGIQNWGVRFQQYGDLGKTIRGTEHLPFRILMSHDPTHWQAQVWGTGIVLTLSGHTHGAQLGVRLGNTTYSPAQWVYKQWAGHYAEGDQQLYINRGFGFIGFPGRVGMPPEITVLELQRV
ncbi:MAG: metallophosphoesterase, partial [Bacteroidota bacterium]|nr:metallophosphoesterase [Bacteroidota bacterium]